MNLDDDLFNRAPPDEAADLSAWVTPIDWPTFWADDAPTYDWVIEPLVPAGRQVAMYASAKSGKSLLALDACAAAATGRSVLGHQAAAPTPIVYIDAEMTGADLRERLEDLGYGPHVDMSLLRYYQLSNLPPLDTDLGGQVLEAVVADHGARLVVLDTMARVVKGDENVADTYRDFARYTGTRLKAVGTALWRIDHAGKDPTKGQRGSSEKAGDVDVVLHLTRTDTGLSLRRTHSRVPWVPEQVTVRIDLDPTLRHHVAPAVVPAVVVEIIRLLDHHGVPADATANQADTALKAAGAGRRRTDILTAIKIRKARQ